MSTEEAAPLEERTTAPQSPYTLRQVATGLLLLAIGLVIVVGIPLAFPPV